MDKTTCCSCFYIESAGAIEELSALGLSTVTPPEAAELLRSL